MHKTLRRFARQLFHADRLRPAGKGVFPQVLLSYFGTIPFISLKRNCKIFFFRVLVYLAKYFCVFMSKISSGSAFLFPEAS